MKAKRSPSHYPLLRRAAVLLSLVMLMGVLSGCWSATELNQLAIVMAIGVDKGADAGHYRVTAQVARAAAFKLNGGDGADAYVNYTYEAQGMNTALHGLVRMTSRKLFTMFNQMVIIGMEAAEQDIGGILDYFIRNEQARYNVSILIADGMASEVLKEKPTLEILPAVHIQHMLDAQSLNGEIYAATIFDTVTDMLSVGMGALIPIVSLHEENGEMRAYLSETAVFYNARMVGRLSAEQTRSLLILRDQMQANAFALQTEDGYISLELRDSSTTIRPRNENGQFIIDVEVEQLCSVADTNLPDDVNSVRNEERIVRMVEAQTFAQLQDIIEYAKSLGVDIFGFGGQLYRMDPKAFEQRVDDWPEAFKNLTVRLSVKAEILGTGAILGPINPAQEAPADERRD